LPANVSIAGASLLGSAVVWQVIVCLVLLTSCKVGGEYAENTRNAGDVDRGEVNGRSFEFVSNKPEGDDWNIRIRDSSMSVGYGSEEKSESLGTIQLTSKETTKVWKLIDELDIENRKQGKKDEDEGYVMLRLRLPGGDEGHDLVTVYVSRATDDDDVIALADYLRSLVGKYRKEKPNF
jgi:hypothetical protein